MNIWKLSPICYFYTDLPVQFKFQKKYGINKTSKMEGTWEKNYLNIKK
jgi:hypothetical protein